MSYEFLTSSHRLNSLHRLKQAWQNNPLVSKETASFRNSFSRIECDPQSCSEKKQIKLNSCDILKLQKVII